MHAYTIVYPIPSLKQSFWASEPGTMLQAPLELEATSLNSVNGFASRHDLDKWPGLNRSQCVPIRSQLELFCTSVNGEIFSLGLQA